MKKKLPDGFKNQAALEKKEEQTGVDYDHDGEKGEPAAHQKKVAAAAKKNGPQSKQVLGQSKPQPAMTPIKKKGTNVPPRPTPSAGVKGFPTTKGKMSSSSSSKSKGACPACTKKGMSSCSH